jgi:hypothetical protein
MCSIPPFTNEATLPQQPESLYDPFQQTMKVDQSEPIPDSSTTADTFPPSTEVCYRDKQVVTEPAAGAAKQNDFQYTPPTMSNMQRLPQTDQIGAQEAPNTTVDARRLDYLEEHTTQALPTPLYHNQSTKLTKPIKSPTTDTRIPSSLVQPPADGLDGDDDISSSDSEVECPFDAEVCVGNKAFWASLDTQSPSNLLFSEALEELGPVKRHPIPGSEIRSISSPLSGAIYTPKWFVAVKIWIAAIGLTATVRLYIVDSEEATNDFKIILGWRFIRKHGGGRLLTDLERAFVHGPRRTSSAIAPLREVKNRKGMRILAAIDKTARERQALEYYRQQAYLKEYQNSSSFNSGWSSQTQNTNSPTDIRNHPAAGQNATRQAPAVQSRCYGDPAGSDKHCAAPHESDFRAELQSQRRDTSSSGLTLLTRYSWKSTTSSVSSYGEAPVDTPQMEGSPPEQETSKERMASPEQ